MNDVENNAVLGTGPRHLRDVTTEWLTACIRSQGGDGTVSTFTAQQLGEGVGMMATLNRLTLEYSSGGGPATLIVKFPGELEANLAVAAQFGLFQREVRFYQRAAGRTRMHTPKIYAAEIDPNSEFVLLMEDLGGMRTGDQITGCDAEETAAAVDELVKLHSAFWNSVDSPDFDFAPIVDGSGQGDVMHNLAIASWDAMKAVHGDAVPQFMESVRQRFLDAIPAMHTWLGKGPLTLIHSDYRLDNLMLGTPPESPAIVALDWQGVMRSKGIEDVAFLLSQSVPVDVRRRIEREQVERYRQGPRCRRHRLLCLTGVGVGGVPPVRALPMDVRRAHLRSARPSHRSRPPGDERDRRSFGNGDRRPRLPVPPSRVRGGPSDAVVG